MAYYEDIREYLSVLEENGQLVRMRREINKDTELNALVKLQYRGLTEAERKAFLFENVTDSKGRKYTGTVATGISAGTLTIYALGLQTEPPQIMNKWMQGRLNPIEPTVVPSGAALEEVHLGPSLLEHGGLYEFPIPIATPGFDGGPYFTAPCWVTKEPETGIVNVGTYRAQVKSPTRTGVMFARPWQHIGQHWEKCRKLGIPLEAAVVVGAIPVIGYVSVAKLAYGENEFATAGGMIGEPVKLVKCRSVDLYVPATAEVVIEGKISTTEMEPEGPFGEALGYMGQMGMRYIFDVTCITHRRNPIWHSFCSQFPPSESSKIRGIAAEATYYKLLRHDLGMSEVKAVAVHEDTGSLGMVVISLNKTDQQRVWQALEAISTAISGSIAATKLVVAIDDDIDPWDAGAVNWMMSFAMQPHRDCRIKAYPAREYHRWGIVDPSIISPEEVVHPQALIQHPPQASHMLINATRKWPYPPHSLPQKEYMERALAIWQEENLPPLKLRTPWWGYSLGQWTSQDEKLAALAVSGEYERAGEMLAQLKCKIERG